jgi:hypothetical protein
MGFNSLGSGAWPEFSRERLTISFAGISSTGLAYSPLALEHHSGFSETTDFIGSLSHFRNDLGCRNFLYLKSALNLIATLPMQACCNQECPPSKMPRIPPVIEAPPSCSFATIRRPKTEKPRAKPTKLIAVDIFSTRLCALILNAGCRFGCAGDSLLSSRASSTYKGIGALRPPMAYGFIRIVDQTARANSIDWEATKLCSLTP